MSIFQYRVAPSDSDLIEIADIYQDLADVVTRKITCDHSYVSNQGVLGSGAAADSSSMASRAA